MPIITIAALSSCRGGVFAVPREDSPAHHPTRAAFQNRRAPVRMRIAPQLAPGPLAGGLGALLGRFYVVELDGGLHAAPEVAAERAQGAVGLA